MVNKLKHYLFTLGIIVLVSACGHKSGESAQGADIMTHAENLTIVDGDGYSLVDIRNPWDTTRMLAQYILLNEGKDVPEGIDTHSRKVIKTPVKNALVYYNIHVSLLHELGALDHVGGVCDSEYITDSVAAKRVAEKSIQDCGLSYQPNIEAIMRLRPDVIVLSPMENGDTHGKLANMNIPVLEAADYLEPYPLGRAEWMKLYGRLVGKGAEADSLFARTEKEYNDIIFKTALCSNLPKVLFDGTYSGIWNVPTSRSATGTLIRDAAGYNPFDDYNDSGSAKLAPEEVIYKAADADVWFVRYFSDTPKTLDQWGKEDKNYSRFKAFKDGNVWGSNTRYSGVFDDAAFHPQWILADMALILHPSLQGIKIHKHYYQRLK